MTCAKRQVLAVVYARNGRSYTGTNDCRNPQATCPRLPGEGYEKCRTVCDQEGHAEALALRAAGDQARGATLKVWGIGWHCRDCQERAFAAGVVALEAPDTRAPVHAAGGNRARTDPFDALPQLYVSEPTVGRMAGNRLACDLNTGRVVGVLP